MRPAVLFVMAAFLSGCISRNDVSEMELRFEKLAQARAKSGAERFPVLGNLPDEPAGEGSIPPETAADLRYAADELTPLRQEASAVQSSRPSVQEVAAELLAEVERLRAEQGMPSRGLSRDDLAFPTPPPLEP